MTDSAISITSEEEDEEAGEDLGDLLLEVLPGDGTTIGNLSAREALSRVAERQISEEVFESVKEKALALGMIRKGRGRGGAIGLEEGIPGGSRYEAPSAPTTRRSTGGNAVTVRKDVTFWRRFMPPLPRLLGGLFAGLLMVH